MPVPKGGACKTKIARPPLPIERLEENGVGIVSRRQWKKGQQIGEWTLSSFLGGGGNGEVWKARGPDAGYVALKILRSRSPKSEPFQRFKNEAHVLHGLSDVDGVVPILGRP